MLCLTATTGNIGGAVLRNLLSQNLVEASDIVIATSSDPSSPKFDHYKSLGIDVRYANYDDVSSLEAAYTGCEKLFLVSTPKISLDFNEASYGSGREKHHIAAINAANKVGVKHVYYSSLAFGTKSKAGVMVAHERTEAYLKNLTTPLVWTVIREGLYAESWPLYFGQYDATDDQRTEVVVGGDGKISWTSIENTGLGTAIVLADETDRWSKRVFYLTSPRSSSLQDVASLVSTEKGYEVKLKVVDQGEYERYSVEDRKLDAPFVRWWSKSYAALREGECERSELLLEELLQEKGKKLDDWEDIVRGMIRGDIVYKSSE